MYISILHKHDIFFSKPPFIKQKNKKDNKL